MPPAEKYYYVVADMTDPPVKSLRAEQASWIHDAAEFEAGKDAIEDAVRREACAIRVLAFADPEAGARRVERASDEVKAQLDEESRLALACELDRLGRTEAAKVLHASLARTVVRILPFERIHALPSLDGLAEELELETRAILEVAAARRTADAAKRAALLDLARKDDVLRCIVPR